MACPASSYSGLGPCLARTNPHWQHDSPGLERGGFCDHLRHTWKCLRPLFMALEKNTLPGRRASPGLTMGIRTRAEKHQPDKKPKATAGPANRRLSLEPALSLFHGVPVLKRPVMPAQVPGWPALPGTVSRPGKHPGLQGNDEVAGPPMPAGRELDLTSLKSKWGRGAAQLWGQCCQRDRPG